MWMIEMIVGQWNNQQPQQPVMSAASRPVQKPLNNLTNAPSKPKATNGVKKTVAKKENGASASVQPVYYIDSDDEEKPAVPKQNVKKMSVLCRNGKPIHGVVYPLESASRFMYPFKLDMMLNAPRNELIDFMKVNGIKHRPADVRRIYSQQIVEFMTAKRDAMKKDNQTAGAVQAPAAQPAPGPSTQSAQQLLITKELLAKLPETWTQLYEYYEKAPAEEIRVALMMHGQAATSEHHGRGELLEKLFLVFMKCAIVEESQLAKKQARKTMLLKNECIVCMDMLISSCLIPCGHACLCENCSSGIATCPVCSGAVQQVQHIYFA